MDCNNNRKAAMQTADELNGPTGIPDEGPRHNGEYEISLAELESLPTLSVGQADDLKIESDSERVWLSRCTVEDGEPYDNKVTVERLIAGSWVEVEYWQAR